jgi:dTDP-D-glucose 4,6-dehydratase
VHRWNQNTIFSVDRMREDFGFEPEYTFRSAVEQTYEWYRREGKQQTNVYDWSFEDRLLDMVKERQPAGVA